MSEEQATSATLTWVLFLGAMVPGWFAWRRTRYFGDKLTNWKRLAQRCAFAGLVFLSVFGFVTYALWKFGVPLSMGLVESWSVAGNGVVSLGDRTMGGSDPPSSAGEYPKGAI